MTDVALRWADAVRAASALDQRPGELQALRLVARLPFVTPRVLARLTAVRCVQTVHGRLRWLHREGLVHGVRPAFRRRGAPRLPYPTDLGLAALSLADRRDHAHLVRRLRLDRDGLAERLPGLEHLLHAYALLGILAASRPGRPRLVAWDRPWRGRLAPGTAKRPASATMPAHAELAWDDGPPAGFFLVPDLGTAPMGVYALNIDLLVHLRHQAAGALPTLVVLVRDAARADAWRALLRRTTRRRRDAPLMVCLGRWAELPAQLAALALRPSDCPTARRSFAMPARVRPRRGCRPGRAVRRVVGGPLEARPSGPESLVARRGRLALGLTPAQYRLLDLVGRHPFLTTEGFAAALRCRRSAARWRRKALIARGLLRLVCLGELARHAQLKKRPTEAARIAALEPVELTVDGLALLTAKHGLRVPRAIRWRSLGGGGPEQPFGTRRQLWRDVQHTLGADRVFVRLMQLAARRGDAVPVWENARACASGTLKPDGYGVYLSGGRRHAFYVEFDRCTMYDRDLRQKLEAYHDALARARQAARRLGRPVEFPTVLVVVGDRDDPRQTALAEARVARVARAVAAERDQELPLLLTREDLARRDPEGLLGPVWRTPHDPSRRSWLPGHGRTMMDGSAVSEGAQQA